MQKFKLVGWAAHPEDLHDGRVLGPNDEVSLSKKEASHPHNLRLIEEGLLETLDGKEPDVLTGEALDKEAARLEIEGRSKMNVDELRAAVAEAQEKEGGNS